MIFFQDFLYLLHDFEQPNNSLKKNRKDLFYIIHDPESNKSLKKKKEKKDDRNKKNIHIERGGEEKR